MLRPTRTLYHTPLTHSLSPTHLQHLPRALLCVSPNGIIEWLEEDVDPTTIQDVALQHGVELGGGEAEVVVVVVEIGEGGLVPGLVDTHTHAPQFPNIGTGSTLELLDWLDEFTFPLESKFSDGEFARRVYEEVVKRTLRCGTTTCCYYSTLHADASKILADICVEQGQRAFIGKCSMDRNSPDYYVEPSDSAMSSLTSFLDHFPNSTTTSIPSTDSGAITDPLVKPILTPRMAISTTPSLLKHIATLSEQHDLPIQTHLSENPSEIAFTLELFPPDQFGDGCTTYTGVYDTFGILKRGTILAHCVHLTDEEMGVIERTGSGVSHCPSSNLNLGSGVARVREMLDRGIKVGLGTDCSGGYSSSLLTTIRDASAVSRCRSFLSTTTDSSSKTTSPPTPLSLAELFYLATMGGAELCRLENQIGNFAVGKEFDALWIKGRSINMWDTADFTLPGIGKSEAENRGRRWERTFETWLWSGDDRDIAGIWVRGRRVVGGL